MTTRPWPARYAAALVLTAAVLAAGFGGLAAGPVSLAGSYQPGCSSWPRCPAPEHRNPDHRHRRGLDWGWTAYTPLESN